MKRDDLLLTLAFLLSLAIFISCKQENSSSQIVDTQGIFDFPDELLSMEEARVPKYLDSEKVLCNGKGLKVAKCISNQLKKGICLGIIKDGKRVYAIEIPCETVKTPEVDTIEVF